MTGVKDCANRYQFPAAEDRAPLVTPSARVPGPGSAPILSPLTAIIGHLN